MFWTSQHCEQEASFHLGGLETAASRLLRQSRSPLSLLMAAASEVDQSDFDSMGARTSWSSSRNFTKLSNKLANEARAAGFLFIYLFSHTRTHAPIISMEKVFQGLRILLTRLRVRCDIQGVWSRISITLFLRNKGNRSKTLAHKLWFAGFFIKAAILVKSCLARKKKKKERNILLAVFFFSSSLQKYSA